jgi:hypothetical protein
MYTTCQPFPEVSGASGIDIWERDWVSRVQLVLGIVREGRLQEVWMKVVIYILIL